MTTKSKVAPATPKVRTRRKSVSKPIQLTPSMIRAHSREQGWKEYHAFVSSLTDAEMRIIGHLKPLTFATPQDIVREARRLLGESIAKCKVIPFPNKLGEHLVERLGLLNHTTNPKLVAIPNRKDHKNTMHDGLTHESSESELKRKMEHDFDDTIH